MSCKYYNSPLWIIFLGLFLFLAVYQSNSVSKLLAAPKVAGATQENSFATASESQQTQNFLSLTKLWSFDTEGMLNASPLLNNGTAYIATREGTLFALDTATGIEQWHFTSKEGIWERSPALADELLIVGLPDQLLVGLDTQTGQEIWRVTLRGDVQRPALVADGMLYVGTTFVGPGLSNDPEQKAWLYALEAATGQEHWSLETDNYVVVTPTIFKDKLYAGGSYFDPTNEIDEGGPMRIYALNVTTGQAQWTIEGEAGFIKHLHADAERLHYLAYQDKLFALDTDTGQQVWEYNTENWTPSFAVAEGLLYFGSANAFVHTLDPLTGELLWKFNIEGTFNFPLDAPQRLGDILYFHTIRQEVYALDANTGTLLWQARHKIPGREALVVAGGQLYVTGRDGTLHIFALPR